MKKSSAASMQVKMIVAWKPNGQFSLILASDPQFAAKLRRQSKTKPMKKASVKPIVRMTKTSEVHWKPLVTKMRR